MRLRRFQSGEQSECRHSESYSTATQGRAGSQTKQRWSGRKGLAGVIESNGAVDMKTSTLMAWTGLFVLMTDAMATPTMVRVGTWEVRVDPGTYQCALDEAAHEADRKTITEQREVNRNSNEVLAIFVPCTKLQAFRAGAPLTKYGILLTPYLEGSIQAMAGINRADFMDGLENAYKKDPRVSREELNNRLKRGYGGTRITETPQLVVLHRDDVALYSGVVMRLRTGQGSFGRAGVIGQTLINGHPLQFTLYEDGNGSRIRGLLEEIQPVMLRLVRNNDPKGAAVGSNWTNGLGAEMLSRGLAGAGAGGVFGIIFATIGCIVVGIRRWRVGRQRKRSAS